LSAVLGILTGVVLVGASTARVLAVNEGKAPRTLLYSGLVSSAHYWMVASVASGDIAGYLGFSVGAAAVTAWMAHRRQS
jgi:hypothetical protein